MVRFIFFLLLIIFINNRLVAQDLRAEKKAATDSSGSKIGFKKQSASPIVEKKSIPKNPAPISIDNHKAKAEQNAVIPGEAKNVSKASEMIRIDYNNMPADVQLKINDNKAQGKYLLTGIAKSFMVEIKSCLTDADQKKTLLFLKSKKGFINSQLVSTGLVKIIVEPTFDSEELKDAMSAEGIHYNFLNRSYLLKK